MYGRKESIENYVITIEWQVLCFLLVKFSDIFYLYFSLFSGIFCNFFFFRIAVSEIANISRVGLPIPHLQKNHDFFVEF